MKTLAEVKLWGKTIGAVSLDENQRFAEFEYDSSFTKSGIQLSPIMMPLKSGVYKFSELDYGTFHGLPGLLSDSIPDRFGNSLIDVWLSKQGRLPESFNAVERLCYTGKRGMGALEYYPLIQNEEINSKHVGIMQDKIEVKYMLENADNTRTSVFHNAYFEE